MAGDDQAGRVDGRPALREVLAACAGLILVAAVFLGPYVLDGGFYSDDWGDVAGRFYPPGGAGFENVVSYFYDIFSYRPLLVVFTPLKYYAFGDHVALHLAWTALLGVAIATMLYGVLRAVGAPKIHAWTIAALTLVYPWFDSVRLWESANPPPLSISFALAGLWIALVGVRRESWRLHACAAGLYLLSILTYEVTLPLIAAFGCLYVLVGGWPVARARWAVDLVVVVLGGIWMGTHTTRSVSGVSAYASHLGEIVDGGVTLLGRTFIPVGAQPHTALALVLAGTVLAAGVATLAWQRRRGTPSDPGWGLREWLLLAAAGLLVAALGWAIFVPADPYYTPVVFGVTNRVNALAGYGLVICAYAVLGTAATLLAVAWPSIKRWAPAVTVAAALLLGAAYVRVLDRHIGLWQTAYDAQLTAIDQLERQYPRLPSGTTLFTTGYPAYQTLGVPIFAATWDLNGMVKMEYEDGTLAGFPVIEGQELVCRGDGVALRAAGTSLAVAPYGKARLLDLASGAHAAPRDRRQCLAVVDRYVAGPMYLQLDY